MNFPNYFADAESTFDEADFIIFGVPYDKTSSFRLGSKKGPDSIRQASWNFETFNLFTKKDLADVDFHDYGNLDVENLDPKSMVDAVKDFTSKILKKNKFPIALGGEHSITSGIIKAYPKDIAVLSLDAHMDFRQKYENEKYNHACVARRISDHINVESIAILGVRSAEKEEFEDAEKQNLFYVNSLEIQEKGIKKALEKTKNYLNGKKIYLTLDIDAIDPSYAPGTGTPEPFGLKPYDIYEVINSFSKQIIGFDVAEVCPKCDKGQTSLLAAKIIRYVIEKIYF